jgi:hypothetical protein
MRLDRVVWSNDCCGKKDYDGPVVSVSTRYWPAGGSAMVFDTAHAELGLHRHDDGHAPCAHCSIMLEDGRGVGVGTTLIESEFEGATFDDVRVRVEEWAAGQAERIKVALKAEFRKVKP